MLFRSLIDSNNLPSLQIIEPVGKFIKKEQIVDLKNKFKYKPIYSKNNIYIIKNAEKLNTSSANTMLKFYLCIKKSPSAKKEIMYT